MWVGKIKLGTEISDYGDIVWATIIIRNRGRNNVKQD